MARRSLFSAISSAAAILILAAGCSDAMPTAVDVDTSELTAESATLGKLAPPNIVLAARGHLGGTFQAVIGPEGGVLEFEGGSLTFPAGAVAENTTIKAQVDARFLAVTFAPHGLQFPADAQPTLSISYAGTTQGDNLKVLYLGDNGAVAEDLGGDVSTDVETVSTQLKHFSAYIIATG